MCFPDVFLDGAAIPARVWEWNRELWLTSRLVFVNTSSESFMITCADFSRPQLQTQRLSDCLLWQATSKCVCGDHIETKWGKRVEKRPVDEGSHKPAFISGLCKLAWGRREQIRNEKGWRAPAGRREDDLEGERLDEKWLASGNRWQLVVLS